jgi:nucleotide-binding universal stress UspA family protein
MKLPNIQIKKILYATDLSETAVHAFSYAVSLANMYGAGITILHVLAEFPGEEFIANMIRDQNSSLFRSPG